MIILLLAAMSSLAAWTIFALLNKGKNDYEIKALLKLMVQNIKDLILNASNLFILLIKDALQTDVVHPDQNLNQNKIIDIDQVLAKKNRTSKDSNESKFNLEIKDEDEALSAFSPEVVQVIEEEEKVA